MMRKLKYLSILLGLIIFNSCSTSEIEVIEEAYDNGNPKIISIVAIQEKDTVKIGERHLYRSGQCRIRGNYNNGRRDGKWESFYDDGALWSTSVYKSGVRNGPSLVYYESGKLHISGQFKDDRASGTWVWFDESGQEIKKIDYSK